MSQHVVIVDDDELNLKLFASIAREIRDVVVHPFRSSMQALEWCRDQDVDCFILDYHLSPPDGLTMIHLLRGIEAFALVPVIIVTGEHERDVRYRAFDAGANDFVLKPVDYRELVARLGNLLSLRAAQKRLGLQIGSLEASLLDSEERSREHAERLEGIWRIANNPALQDEELVLAMLGQAAVTIRPGQTFIGLLGRIEGPDLVTVAVADPAGGTVYALTFASNVPADRPFGDLDHTYIEILAEFFASRIQQQWQASRLRDQLQHDSLTALANRTRFRSLGRAAIAANVPCAVAVIDVVDFHELNEAYGHLTGDAVLVEIAAALAARVTGDEIVARVGGDSFGLCFPAVPFRGWAAERVAQYTAVFDLPISIGDREGKEAVSVRGVAGVAFSPDDGATLDELLFRAEARARL